NTYAVVSLFGFGIGTYDLNALESNRWSTPVADPNVYVPQLEQVLISDAKYQAECVPTEPLPPFTCNPNALAARGFHCPIPDLQFNPDSIVLSGPPPKLVIYGLHARNGLVD